MFFARRRPHAASPLWRRRWAFVWFVLVALCCGPLRPAPTHAQQAYLELSFVPARGVQSAVWVERDDGLFMGTLSLTYATATAGIGNRPGATQMNSGYRWPYGRREGVLPIWAHRRAAAPGAQQFQRVIFQDRPSEGHASRTVDEQSADQYYCLSIDQAAGSREALDAVTCASVFSSDKGRFITADDVQRGYAEPFTMDDGTATFRALSLTSLYPPRRDVHRCTLENECFDHADCDLYAQHALRVMPELDAIARATPAAEGHVSWSFAVPAEWSSEHAYKLYLEVNTEGDYNDSYNPERYPSPTGEEAVWDSFAQFYGYSYRGQPSVLYELPFRVPADAVVATHRPIGYGALHGEDGEVRPLDDSITDDPAAAPGSGADRLRDLEGVRAELRVMASDACAASRAAPLCGAACTGAPGECGALACNPATHTCQSPCSFMPPPAAVTELRVTPHPDRQLAHMWARLSFRTAESERPIGDYEVKVRPAGGDWMLAFTPDSAQRLLPVGLDVCRDESAASKNRCLTLAAGSELAVDLANLRESTAYEVRVTPRDAVCKQFGPAAQAQFSTLQRSFTTVSPCFIATAAFGSPLASEIAPLRRLRDRYLLPNAPGRALVAAYYRIGPTLAEVVREHAWLRAFARSLIALVLTATHGLD